MLNLAGLFPVILMATGRKEVIRVTWALGRDAQVGGGVDPLEGPLLLSQQQQVHVHGHLLAGLCHTGIQLQLLNIQPGLKSKEGDLQGVRVSDVVEGVSQVGVELDQISLVAVSRT